MNVGELKKILRGLKDDTPIRVVTKGIRPYKYGGGKCVGIEFANPCYNQDKPSEVWLDIYTDVPTKIVGGEKDFEYYMSLPYTVIIQPSPEGGFVAKIRELPGCLSQGDTEEEALEMIQDAKMAWIDIAIQDGTDITEPNKS
ncbi:type II toxin-antitoxin system HicB family antitoxin [Pelosinus propionicus]|uniref:Predicted nuclease of the RNAse H fold, HicB family n=1 Tax=Pelosinus propionicus DSM 13327 TaxID=1123291 RepID=A0A1I4HQ08_9FIRM|nr:type II toxin-antitoxin system HicB family antitoxin [Pelosinus propionicus]SFL43843.1 Predicted nuclease of the RNAse H fold, HicB family [Pelosinus propionicus DSM 13327]